MVARVMPLVALRTTMMARWKDSNAVRPAITARIRVGATAKAASSSVKPERSRNHTPASGVHAINDRPAATPRLNRTQNLRSGP